MDYPTGTQSVLDHFKNIDKHDKQFNDQFKLNAWEFVDCAKKGTTINFRIGQNFVEETPAELMCAEVREESLKACYTAWLKGEKEEAFKLFDDLCKKAMLDAVESVTECNAEFFE